VRKPGNITAESRAQEKRTVDFQGEEGIQRLFSYLNWAVSITGKVYKPCPIMSQNDSIH
jgi:hypothetical protein